MIILILVTCVLPTTLTIDYKVWYNSRNLPERLLNLMKNYNERAKSKVIEISPVRSKYDVSPHFEAGYLVSEILERYRKMVVILQHHYDYAIDLLFDLIKSTEMIQKLFLEIYHLVNMFHEIPRKYSHMLEFHKKDAQSTKNLEDALKKIQENERNREIEKKMAMKQMKKQWKLYMMGMNVMRPTPRPKPKNKWWPIDYGWEIDYYW